MNIRLFFESILKFLIGLVLIGIMLFLSAFSFKYYNAWLFIILLFVPMFIFGLFLMIKNPKLLKRRLDVKEGEKEQKKVIIYSGILFILVFVTSGLNYRFHLINMPKIVVIISSILFIISYFMYAVVLLENEYLFRTIKVEDSQKVIDSGLYSIIRHPMYLVTTIMFLTIPLILGSLISFIIMLLYIPVIIKRIKNEEEVLCKSLKGYKEYIKKVKYRLIPFVW